MATIDLGKGYHAIVDDEDLERLSAFRWRSWKAGDERYRYAVMAQSPLLLMHRFITNAPRGMVVDHANGNRLDNRKCNLRVCTHAENLRNQQTKSAGLKGVRRRRYVGAPKWRGVIQVNGKQYSTRQCDTPEDAARAYDELAIRLHGEFASLNFPQNDEPSPVVCPGITSGIYS